MKIVYALLIGIIVFSFAGAVQAEEDYSGTYACSGTPQEGCGECKLIEIEPPSGLVVTKVGDNTYKICPQFNSNALGVSGDEECDTVTLTDGVAHWSGSFSGEGETVTGEATLTFSDNNIEGVATGKASGKCNCDISVQAFCSK